MSRETLVLKLISCIVNRLIEDCGVALYCDMHAHSRKHNIFIYGCENMKRHPDRRLLEQVFPLMLHKNVANKFSYENCKFRVQKNKEGTGRIVVWVLGVTNSYTLEASFAGSTLGGRAGTHFSTMVSNSFDNDESKFYKCFLSIRITSISGEHSAKRSWTITTIIHSK